jgi:hypothetical protein
VLALVAAGALAGSALGLEVATAVERPGGAVGAVVVVERATAVERLPAPEWIGGIAAQEITVPAGQRGLVRVRVSGASRCERLLLRGDCRLRVAWRSANATTWAVAAPGSVRVDAHAQPATEALEAITPLLAAGTYDVRVEWWSGPDTTFTLLDSTVVFERIRSTS